MNRGGLPKVVPVVLIVVVIAIAVAALYSLGRTIFGSEPVEDTTDPGQTALVNTTSTYSTRMTVRGPIVAEEDFRSYQITISPDGRTLVTYEGYTMTPIDEIELANNTDAYEEFVYALSRANLMNGTELDGDANDRRGICASGRLYEFEVLRGNTVVKSLWTTSCKNIEGSLTADLDQVSQLYRVQIPDSRKLIRSVGLR